MRRLFPNYFDGWPGLGLVLLRLVEGIPAIVYGISQTSHAANWIAASSCGLEIGLGLLLLGGLFTPLAALIDTLLELVRIAAGGSQENFHLQRAVVAASLAMLGPGVWSIDARLFGRRRIDLTQVSSHHH